MKFHAASATRPNSDCQQIRRLHGTFEQRAKKLALVTALFLVTGVTLAPQKTLAQAVSCQGLFKSPGGNSVEIEMLMSDDVLAVLTTTDGTVGGLIGDHELPDFYKTFAERSFPQNDPRDLKWDLVPNKLKRQLVVYASSKKTTSVWEDRRVPNIRVKGKVWVRFVEPTEFLGTVYPAGHHEVDVSKFFGQVEFLGEKSAKTFSGIELHFRHDAAIPADRLVEYAWAFQRGIGNGQGHLHEHMVVPMPKAKLVAQPIETALAITEHYRRTELLTELTWILERREIIPRMKFDWKTRTTDYFFDSLHSRNLAKLFNYLSTGYLAGEKLANDALKFALIGFRGPYFYDAPDLIGYEHRGIHGDSDPVVTKKSLAAIETSLRTENYGVDVEQMKSWISAKGVRADDAAGVTRVIETAWHNRAFKDVVNAIPEYLRGELGGTVMGSVRLSTMIATSHMNRAMKMFFYDWASDPLFHGDPEAQKRVIEEQKRAVRRVFGGGENSKEVLREFIWNAGIVDRTARTFNLTQNDFSQLMNAPKKRYRIPGTKVEFVLPFGR